MSTPTASVSTAPVGAFPVAPGATKALMLGLAGIGLTALGLFLPGNTASVALSWLIGLVFWIGVALGMLLLVMIHHLFDANWSVLLRRQYEHWLSSLPWLALLFVPLIFVAWTNPTLIWKWMDPHFDLAQVGGHGTVGDDVLWAKKSGFLSIKVFTLVTAVSFAVWIALARIFRRNSFAQDSDGDVRWTISSHKWSAGGIPLMAVTLTLCVILWVKSLDYHWFSTMYGVWYFAGCVRAALSVGAIMLIWLWVRGDFKGILNDNHLHSIGQLMFAFTVFWAYVTFSQYFLIWNANVPEETFWYNLREHGDWLWVGMVLLFGHFLAPFLTLIHYPVKINKKLLPVVAAFIALIVLLDICYNVMPAKKLPNGDPYPFLQGGLIWTLTSVVGIGGICVWAYLKSFATTKLIPIRDPRIGECLTYHQPHAD
ncbi:MAG: hypothetical protein HZA31_02855 [Opitutae bacterium]|nr:hypothetical protein [Opitutae bacterium]